MSADEPRQNECPNIARCPIFPRLGHGLPVLQALYCEGCFEHYERYRMANGGTMPPLELMPDGSYRTL